MIPILIPVLSLSFSAVVTFYLNRTDHSCSLQIKLSAHSVIDVIFYVILVLLILGLFVIVSLLLYFYSKFWTTHGVTRRARWLLLEFTVLPALLLTEFALVALLSWIDDSYTVIVFAELAFFMKLVILLVLLTLVYLPDIHYHSICKCFKGAPDQRPLLVNSGTQHTNPASVWDHANVPSYTVYSPPPEMSVCVTDTNDTL